MKTTVLLPLVFLWVLLACGHGEGEYNPRVVHEESATLLSKEDFAGLEKLAAELRKKGYDVRFDSTQLGAFYGGLKLGTDATNQEWMDRLPVLKKWSAAFPKSLTARLAIANWFIGYAWRARGGGYADTITPEGGEKMESSATRAEDTLEAVPEGTKIDDPIYYKDWLDLCLLQGKSKDEMFDYLEKGTALAPEFEPLYLGAAIYLMDRWYGDPLERETWMKKWADTFPPEKGDVLYAELLTEDAGDYGEELFKKPVDYDRAKLGFQRRLAEGDPAWERDGNSLIYLAMVKGDRNSIFKTLVDLEGDVDYSRYASADNDGWGFYMDARSRNGVDRVFDDELAMERDGLLADAEKRLLTLSTHAASYRPLANFYERQGMEKKLLAMKTNNEFANYKTFKELVALDIEKAAPEELAELVNYYPMMGEWDKAETVAKKFDDARPYNLMGKDVLLLCAIQKGDAKAEQDEIGKIAGLETDRLIYKDTQSVLSGTQPWEKVSQSGNLTKRDTYLSQGILAIAFYYMSKGQNDEARSIIEQSLPNCMENSGKTMLQSLVFGSLGRTLKFSASPPPAVSLSPAGVKIVAAHFGSGNNFADVTDRVKDVLAQPVASFRVGPDWLNADPAVGWRKQLNIDFEVDDSRYTFTCPEDTQISLRVLKEYVRDQKK